MPEGDYSYGTIGIDAEIDGERLEVVQANIIYPLTGLPTATLKLAIGHDGQGGSARGHQAVQKAQQARTPARILGRFAGNEKPGQPWSSANPVLFDGFVAGPRVDAVAAQTMGLVVDLEHNLAELDTGNKLSYALHAESEGAVWKPVMWDQSEVFKKEVDSVQPILTPPSAEQLTDLWGKLLRPGFQELAQKGADRIAEYALQGLDTPNKRVLGALERVKGEPVAGLKEGREDEARCSVANMARQCLGSPGFGQSIWDTLKNFCALWRLAVVPRFENNLVVPFCPVAKTFYKTIEASEIFSVSAQEEWPRMPIRGVALMSRRASDFRKADQLGGRFIMGGVADMSLMGGDYSGQMLALAMPAAFSKFSTPVSTAQKLPTEADNSAFIGNPGAVKPASVDPELAAQAKDTFGNELALAMLSEARFQGRSMNVTGRVRFDLAPGSPVAVEVPGEEGAFTTLYGTISQVSYVFSAEQPYAATSLVVSYLRTAADQKSPLVSDQHPLYGEMFKGAGMLGG